MPESCLRLKHRLQSGHWPFPGPCPASLVARSANEDREVKRWAGTISVLATLLAMFLAGCGGRETADTQPTVAPAITSTNPIDHATGVPISQTVAATFSEGMNPASFTNAGFTLTGPGGAAVAGTVRYVNSGSTATFTPSSPLAAGSLFTATLTTAARDLAGNGLAANYVWNFTTGAVADTTPPTVTATNPANNAIGVPFNQAVAATFSKGMNPVSVTNASFTLTGPGGVAVPGTVAYVVSGSTATFTPTSPLAAGSLFTATITTAARDLAGNVLAANYVWSFTTGAAPDTTPPAITATNPANNAIGVPLNQAVAATFSEGMNPVSVTNASFTLTGPGGVAVPGTVAYVVSGSTATFTPTSPLAATSLFTVTITTAVTDLAGNALAVDYAWSFTTGAAPDTTPPTITATNPANNVTAVPFNQVIAATFSKGMNSVSVTNASFTLTGPGDVAVPGTVAYVVSGSTATFTPSSPLAAGSLFTATITTAATDLAGNALAVNYVWSFTTGAAPDTTPPTITATNPANNVTAVPLNQAIAATFSKGMNPVSVTNASFTLTGPGGAAVPGTVTYVVSGSTATFTPSSPLAASSLFTATITTAARDLAGNALAANYVWSFTTGAAPDTTPPTITATNPANNVTAVPFNQAIAATFSKGMNPVSVTNASFTLTGPGDVAVPGTVTYVVSGSTATFTPSFPLAASSLFTATITTAATDLAGNALAENYVWSFTTGAAPDTTPPIITATNPANNVTAVPLNQAIAATFSEGMNPVSVTNASFTLTGPGDVAVPGTVAYVVSGSTATFTPSSPLAASSLFTATITTAATDLAGYGLAANYVWSFTTGAAPDTTPPTITATNPADNVTGVAFNQAIAATFSEGMNALSISNGGFILTGPGGVMVPGTVTYVVSGSTATFTPSTLLAAGSLFTATITTAATDLAGNAVAANYVWSFTTGAAPDTTPPTITATNPANNVTGVPINQLIAAAFSEGMNPGSVTNGGFTLTGPGGVAVPGTVAYVVSGSTASFTPSSPLAGSSLFTATVTTAATDLAGNALAANYVWSFTTGAAPDTTPPTITATNPANGSTAVATTTGVNASFSEAMDATSISSATFQLTGPGNAVVPGTVTYDAVSFIATFTPSAVVADNTTYTATVTSAVTDLAGNALASGAAANPWSFTTGTTAVPPPVPLGTASLFGGFGGSAGMTNTGESTVINGNIGTTGGSAVVTGFHDNGTGCTYTETGGNLGLVNGAIDTGAPPPTSFCPTEGTANTFSIATQAASDAVTAYADLAAFPGGLDVSTCTGCGGGAPGELGGRTLAPGIYKSVPMTYGITAGDLTLDAQGDANAFWVFQMGTTLTVGTPSAHRSVILLNGAQAKNVFWQVGTAVTLNSVLGGGTMVGTIIAQSAITVSTAGVTTVTTINGRALCLAGPVALVNTVINVPAP